MLREGDYKLIANRGKVELFDLKNDPAESKDLAREQPQRADRMLALWKTWNESNSPPLWKNHTGSGGKNDFQYADYEWLKGTLHYRSGNE